MRRTGAVLPALLLACGGGMAHAALGGAPLPGPAQAAPGGPGWQVQQRQLATGTTVREYVGSDGTVFAVRWSGPFLPDLQALLGPSFETLRRAPTRGPGALVIREPGLVLLSAGGMGRFEGRAWLPARVPAGVDPEQLP